MKKRTFDYFVLSLFIFIYPLKLVPQRIMNLEQLLQLFKNICKEFDGCCIPSSLIKSQVLWRKTVKENRGAVVIIGE